MKLKLLAATAAALAVAFGALAKGPASINTAALKQLTAEFKGASNVTWSSQAPLSEASFEWNGQKLHAFYNQEGDQVALSREISEDKLPIKAMAAIKEKYDGYKATEAIEYNSSEEGLSYYVSLTNGGKNIILNVTADGSVSVFK